MFYKISNIAQKDVIERKFQVTFQFPNLYEPQKLIEGLKESTVAVITNAQPDKISYAIWGLLPETFEDNWSVFQDVFNTLNVRMETLQSKNELYNNTLKCRRCVVICTGFYTTYLSQGSVERCLVHLPNYQPFPIAAIYNELSDGFLTCSLILIKANTSFKNIPNISELKPFVLNDDELKYWLDSDTSIDQIIEMCENHSSLDFVFELEHSVV
ncbi:SOS response associated peptidase (SRAP) [Gelidibacter sediminis]|uniref:Abasic site processing protein n=1 Tax=Gelidibacter sediminis TaxID=1608710 RepID=A0A4R7PZL5_9FLAO|nr:SOS response-associated peptidase family protein [Gelidibacter sediminis]TDU39570.1 SOS response associated peptidase (SRAP) [Gelidibacter sediminis]